MKKILKGSKIMKVINLLIIVSFIIAPIYPAFAEDLAESPVTPIVEEIIPSNDTVTNEDISEVQGENVNEEVAPNEDAPVEPTDENESLDPLYIGDNPQKIEPQKITLGEVDEHSGAFVYSYAFPLPPFRGMNPELSINYNSQNESKNSITGYGFELSIPYIRRLNREGSNSMYGKNYFYSSISGELEPISIDNNGYGKYGSKTETDSFLSYVRNSDNSWTMKTKDGLVYVFGTDTTSRQDDSSDLSKIFSWYLTSTTDLNNNQISYTYTKDANQVYPSSIIYGPYNISLSYVNASDTKTTQYNSVFAIKANKKLDKVEINFNGGLEKVFNIFYTLPQFNRLSLIDKIIDNSIPTKPQVTEFNYTEGVFDFIRDPNWNMPSNGINGLPLEIKSTFIDLNNDGLIDFITTNSDVFINDGGSQYNDSTKTVFINTGSGFERDPDWDMPYAGLKGLVMSTNTSFVDINNDGLIDFVYTTGGTPTSFIVDGGSPYNDYNNTVFINTGSGFERDPDWDMPYSMSTGSAKALPLTVNSTFADINNDGFIDFISTSSSNNAFVSDGGSPYNDHTNTVFINDGSDFVRDPDWDMPYKNYQGIYNLRLQTNSIFADLNNDGLIDFFYAGNNNTFIADGGSIYNDPEKTVFLNNGTDFVRDPNWDMPYSTASGQTKGLLLNANSTLIDINNDGLLDFVSTDITNVVFQPDGGSPYNDSTKTVFINTGTDFARDPNWDMPYSTASGNPWGLPLSISSTLNDVNDDNLVDFVYTNSNIFANDGGSPYNDSTKTVFINTGTDFARDPDWDMPYSGSNGLSLGSNATIVDVDNDGLSDFINTCSTTNCPHALFINTGVKDVILNSVTTPSGGEVNITYQEKEIENFFPGGARLPSHISVVKSISYDDLISPLSTTNYIFENGKYYFDFNNPININFPYKRFTGFGLTTKTDPNGNVTKTYYHQADFDNTSLGESDDHRSKIGKAYRIEEYDNLDNLYRLTINKWVHFPLNNNYPTIGYDLVKLDKQIVLTYDGNSTHSDTATTYEYENTNGNLIQKVNLGKIIANSDGSYSDLDGDKISEKFSYVSPDSNMSYVSGLLCQDTIFDSNNFKIKDTKIYYDNNTLPCKMSDHGNQTKIEQWVKDDALGNSVYIDSRKNYDSYGLVLSDTDSLGKITSYTYDSFNLYPIVITNPLSQTTQYLYDYSSGKVRQMIDENGLTYQIIYDGLDRVIEEKVPSFTWPYTPITKTAYIYTDTPGAIRIEKIDYLDGINTINTYQYYDGLGRLNQVRSEAEILDNFNVIDTVYDARGFISKQSLPYTGIGATKTPRTTNESLYINTIYDPLGRILTTLDSTGITNYSYDDWKTTTVDKNGKIKNYYNDVFNNLIKVEEINNGAIYTTTYDWDVNHKLIKITDALGNIRNFVYDRLGRRVLAEDLHNPNDTTFGIWTYTYDNNSNLISVTNPRSFTINYIYNDSNQLLSEDNIGTIGAEVSYTYGGCSNGIAKLCGVSMPSGVNTTYAYDSNGNIVSEIKRINGVTYMTYYSYDYLGHLLLITYPDGAEVKYTYNTAGLLEKIERKEAGEEFTDVVSNFDYNPMNQIIKKTYPNNVITENIYDSNKLYRLTSRQTIGNSKLEFLNYTYDNIGNITKIIDASNTDNAGTINYTYDDLYRLTSATASGQNSFTQSFTYNPIGNIITSPSGTYLYLGNTGILKANPHTATSIGGVNNTYDSNGNLLNDGTITNTWNYKDQLTKTIKDNIASNYVYDHNGERVSSIAREESTIYPNDYYNVYRDSSVLYSTKKTKQIYGNGQLVATIETTLELDPDDNVITVVKPYYIHTDHLGSTNVITDENGELVESQNYYPYGSPRTLSGSYTNQRQYIGEIYDSITGLNYLNARYYDASRGQFISQDPMFWSPEKYLMDPQSMNSYSYARNNPIIMKDQNGQWVQIVVGAAIGAAILGGITYYQTGDWNQTWKAAAGGAVAGAIVAAVGPIAVESLSSAMLVGGGSAVVGGSTTRLLNGEEVNANTMSSDFFSGAIGGGLGYGAGKAIGAVASKIIPKNTNGMFPSNPDELMPELPRDAKGYIYPNENTRIRIETHGLGENGEFIPRHSELHYHVDYRPDPAKGWSNSATKTITPPGWMQKAPKGFLPGENFPGTTITNY